LNRAGFDAGPEDGSAGQRFDAAVRALQKAAGITVDGRVGPGTRAALALAEIGEALEPITEEAELMAAKDDIIAAIDALPAAVWNRMMAPPGSLERTVHAEALLRFAASGAQVAELNAKIAGLSAAVEALADQQGIDPEAVTAAIREAVEKSTADMRIVLT